MVYIHIYTYLHTPLVYSIYLKHKTRCLGEHGSYHSKMKQNIKKNICLDRSESEREIERAIFVYLPLVVHTSRQLLYIKFCYGNQSNQSIV